MALGFDAVIFDLDGVITDTASVHCSAWKQTFDEVLEKYYQEKNISDYKFFDPEKDYLLYVDGKPRYDGVQSFFESRGIEFPYGNLEDSPEELTICGIGNKKNVLFNKILQERGADVFESTVELIKQLKSQDIKIGVASSSKNCMAILKRAGLDHLFEVFVDGIVSEKENLKGKPAPDIFINACDKLGVNYYRTAIVEDAVSGVAAGKEGNFGLVIGIARHDNSRELRINGADIVVSDLSDIDIKTIQTWFEAGLKEDCWCLKYFDFDPEKEKSRESLLAVGNGFFTSRGNFCEEKASKFHYPGTYMAGVYNKLSSQVQDKTIFNEDLVNCPNWLYTTFKIDDEDFINSNEIKILDIERNLDMKKGILSGWALIEDKKGRRTMIESVRFISMFDRNVAGMEYSVTPLNYSAKITIKTGIDGNLINDGVERYRQLNQHHLDKAQTGREGNVIWLKTSTTQSKINIEVAAKLFSSLENYDFETVEYESEINAYFVSDVKENKDFVVRKIVAYSNSLNPFKVDVIEKAKSFELLSDEINKSVEEWKKIWEEADISINGDRLAQKLLRLHIYHTMISASKHICDLDVSIGARGLHGEAYRGHIFWDELFILPFYNIHFPEITRSMLMYRYRRLDAARKYAADNGYSGAMFPWQSGSTGEEETQELHLNPKSGKWGPDYSRNQRHVSLAIAYNIIRYHQATNDNEFIKKYGMEMLVEICRFFVSACKYSAKDFRYHTENMMGPDEFHEKAEYSDERGGLRDNAYTNVMLAWTLSQTLNLYYKYRNIKPCEHCPSEEELKRWKDISENLNVNISEEGIIEQFDGYFNLKELDWEYYRQKYGNIYRMDRILKAEGDDPDKYKLSKQADVLMIFYNLSDKEVNETFVQLGYELSKDYLEKNFYYYLKRTSHGSTLSRIVHAYVANKLELYDIAEKFYREALMSDYIDIQGGTTAEGIHSGVMAATVMYFLNVYAGIEFKSKVLSINPKLPEKLERLKVRFIYRGVSYNLIINRDSFNIKTSNDVGVSILNTPCVIEKDEWWNIDLPLEE